MTRAVGRWAGRHRWALAWGAVALALAGLRLGGLASSPPGLHQDEAAIGYDAWAIAHHGLDEHGARFPLFFESFGDFKSPVYFYALAPLTTVLPLTAAVVRLPAALCGLAVCALTPIIALRLTGSRPVALLALVTAGLMPWLLLESRVGFEVVTMTLSLTVALWCLARAEGGPAAPPRPGRWFAAAGLALAIAEYAYPSGRLLVGLLLLGLVISHSRSAPRGWGYALGPPLAGYAGMAAWSIRHPGALTARFEALSITGDHPSPATAVARFAGGYAAHLDAPFLLLRGDSNPRHSTGLGGMLLLAAAPALLAGVVACWRRRREPLAGFALLGLAAAPVPAALTMEGIPHALRSAGMIPLLLLVSIAGWERLLPWLSQHRRAAMALLGAGLLQSALYAGDLFLTYPARAAGSFDDGVESAVLAAHQRADGRPVLLSDNLGQPYIHALFALRPPPRAGLNATLASIGMRQLSGDRLAALARPGDVLVLSPRDRPPAGSTPLLEVRIPRAWSGSAVAVRVYRR